MSFPRKIHLYDIPVSAGTGNFLDEADFETIEVGQEVPESADFGVRITGDSLSLISLNSKYKPIPIGSNNTFKIFGKVVG